MCSIRGGARAGWGAIGVLECIDGRNENRCKSCNVQEVKMFDLMGY